MKQTIGILLIAACAAVGQNSSSQSTGHAGAEFEKHFLAMMPHHHEQAIEMAQLCDTKAARKDVRSLCKKMKATQEQENQQMKAWRQSWYQNQGSMAPAEMDKMHAMHKKHMSELNAATGEKFDHAFLMAMTQHHRDGLPEMKSCQAKAIHQELKQLCGKMFADQQTEIRQMQGMMKH